MAKENVGKFFEAVMAEDEKKSKLQELGKGYEGKQPDDAERAKLTEEHILPMAKEMGFEFTLEELKAYETEQIEARKAEYELSDDELDKVAAGDGGLCAGLGLGWGNWGTDPDDQDAGWGCYGLGFSNLANNQPYDPGA